MSYDDFVSIMAQFPFLRSLKLQGLGEIFLNKDILKMIEYSKRRGVSVRFNNNASLVNDKVAEALLDMKLDAISFSLDTLERERYKEIRGVDSLEIVKGTISNFLRLRNSKETYRETRVLIVMVVMDHNVHELSNIIEFASAVGADKIVASFAKMKASSDEQSTLVRESTRDLLSGTANREATKEAARELARELNIRLGFLDIKRSSALRCKWPWRKVYITYDGYVTPCCHLEDPKVFNFGNILETPFRRLWNGRKYRRFRRRFFDWSSICSKCPHLAAA